MKVLIICVNYNSYRELHNYLKSIDKAESKASNCIIDVVVADNSSNLYNISTDLYKNINVQVQVFDNLGYLGAVQNIINQENSILDYDFVIISNVDIQISEEFFIELNNLDLDANIAWIAPKIYSKYENRDRNPKVLTRYSKNKLSLLYFMYKYPIFFYLYTATAYKRKKFQQIYPAMDIYAGHGSFMILTRSFFESYKEINYPIFLFGEELYLAEEIRNVSKKVRYIPSLVIYDNEHVSTSKLKKRSYFKYNQESIKYILDKYYNE